MMVTRIFISTGHNSVEFDVKMPWTLGNLVVFQNSFWWLLKLGGTTRVAYRYVLSITVDTFVEKTLIECKCHKHLIHTGRHLTRSRRQPLWIKYQFLKKIGRVIVLIF